MTDDQALISKVITGDEQAIRLLIKQHERLVAHMVGRLVKQNEDREELCQDVFVRIIEKLPEFSFQSRLSTWIATIAYRHAINHLRKYRIAHIELTENETWEDRFVENENPETLLSENDMNDWIVKLIDRLPLQYKTVLTLYHLDGMNYAEIGVVTDMPEGTVKNYLFRARQMLKESVKNHLGE